MRKMVFATITILVTSIFIPVSYGKPLDVVGYNWIYAVAVTGKGKLYRGVLINISVIVTKGQGEVYISTSPLAEKDMQASALTAARIACEILGKNFFNYNFYYKVSSNAIIVGGPSAGIPLTVVTFSALSGIPINRNVLATGMINPDGAVGPVGGIPEKSEAAAKFGAKIFLIPFGQSIVTKYEKREKRIGPFIFTYVVPVKINMTKYALENWGMLIKEIRNIYEAIEYMTGYKVQINTIKKVKLSKNIEKILEKQKNRILTIAEEYYVNVSKEINASTLHVEEKRRLLNTLKKYSLSAIIIAKKSSEPYYAIEQAFNSAVYTEWIRLVYQYYSGKSIDCAIRDIEEYINSTLNFLLRVGDHIKNVTELSIYVGAIYNALDSLRSLDFAKKLWKVDVYESLYYASLSKWRAYRASMWVSFISQGNGRYNFSLIKRIAETYLAECRSTLSYTSAVLEESGYSTEYLEDSLQSYEMAKMLFEKKRYLFSCIESIRSLSYSETAFNLWIISVGTNPGYLISHARFTALLSISKILSVTDPVFSELFFLKAENASQIAQKIFCYKISSYHSKLLHDLLTYNKLNYTNISPSTLVKSSNETGMNTGSTKEQYGKYMNIVYFLLAVFIILAIIITMLYIIRRSYNVPRSPSSP